MSSLNIKITSQNGATLNTEGKYCDKDIVVVPELEDKVVTPTTEKQLITPSSGYAGIRSVEVGAAKPDPKLQSKTAEENGTVEPDEGYDGLSSVVVKVEIPEELPWYQGEHFSLD